MYALAVIILITAQTGAVRYSAKYSAATEPPPPNYTLDEVVDNLVTRSLRKLDDREGPVIWPQLVVRCARELGISRCMKAFALCRAQRAATATAQGGGLQFDLEVELERQFPWESYSNASEEQLDSWLLDRAAEVFHQKAVTLTYPGIVLDVDTQRNGSLRIDLKKDATNEVSTGRGRNRWRKGLYRAIPLLLIPPLVFAAILPFVLPALGLLTMGAVILNNMVFTGSLFTLLRNNAFNEKYEKKVIYANDGYKNEEAFPPFPEGTFQETNIEGTYSDGNIQNPSLEPSFFSEMKVKKRRGYKKKNAKRKPSIDEPNWGSEGVYPLEDQLGGPDPYITDQKLAGGGMDSYGTMFQEVGPGSHGTGDEHDLADYTEFRNRFKSKLDQ